MCVISEVNDPSKEVKVYDKILLSKNLEKWFPKCSIQSIDNRVRYSFDTIDIEGISVKIKTYTRWRLQDGPSYLQITAQMNVTKRKLLILIKNFICLWLRFSQTTDLSDRGQLL